MLANALIQSLKHVELFVSLIATSAPPLPNKALQSRTSKAGSALGVKS